MWLGKYFSKASNEVKVDRLQCGGYVMKLIDSQTNQLPYRPTWKQSVDLTLLWGIQSA